MVNCIIWSFCTEFGSFSYDKKAEKNFNADFLSEIIQWKIKNSQEIK